MILAEDEEQKDSYIILKVGRKRNSVRRKRIYRSVNKDSKKSERKKGGGKESKENMILEENEGE